MTMSKENLDQRIAAELACVENRSEWINQIFRLHGIPSKEPIQVAHFNVGNGEELIHSRKVYPNAKIFAFDVVPLRV